MEEDLCLRCGAPENVAPQLIGTDEKGNCYFKGQPSTPQEVDAAIRAVDANCCGGYHYCGDDPAIASRIPTEAWDGRPNWDGLPAWIESFDVWEEWPTWPKSLLTKSFALLRKRARKLFRR